MELDKKQPQAHDVTLRISYRR